MGSRKKILFLITKGNFGGAQKYVYNLATRLPKDQFEVLVACGTKEGNSLIEKLEEAKIRTIELSSSEREINLKKDIQTIKELIKIIGEEKPNVLHLNSSKIGFLGSLAILYLKIKSSIFPSFHLSIPKCIFTSHGWAFNEDHRSALSKIIFYIAHYLTVVICDLTIAVSEKTKRDIAWLPFINQKITVIHNGIEKFQPLTKKECAETLKREGVDQKIILTIGELHPNKGIDIAIRGVALLPTQIRKKIIYYIVGEGEQKAKLEELVLNLELQEYVRFVGPVENAKKILPGTDIMLVPSRTENLPFVVLEAGFCSIPTIATAVGGIPEIIKDMQNGILVHPRNPKEIAEAIIYLIDHKEKQKEFGQALKNTITNFFSFEKMLAETLKIYLDSIF